MHLHPDIAALRGNRASQQHAQAPVIKASKDWRQSRASQALANSLEAYAGGEDLSGCELLETLLSDHAAALQWAREWIAALIVPLCEEPLGEVPLRSHHSNGFSTIQLLNHGRARLSLYVCDRHTERPMSDIALWADRESTELLLCGSARGTLHSIPEIRADGAEIQTSHYEWRAGERMVLVPEQARQFLAVDETLLVLQLSRSADRPRPTREYRLSDGAVVKSASGDKQASRNVMALAVLGAIEHRPALDVMEDLVNDRRCDSDVRWEAVRQALSLDSTRGLILLNSLEKRACDPLAEPARSLRAQLLAAYPQLANLPLENA
ncbi:MAG: hypothetical protein AAF941_09615 [Pseudomonadota bacterium]